MNGKHPQYRLYIDESGDHSFRDVTEIKKRFLCLLGCVIELKKYRELIHPGLEELKQDHFPHNPDDPVIFVRQEIVSKKGPFFRLRDEAVCAAFDQDLLSYLIDMPFIVIAVVIDKEFHQNKYGKSAFHPYHYCLTAMLERYCGYLNYIGAQGDIMAESRAEQDQDLQRAFENLLISGTQFRAPGFFAQGLTSRQIKFKKKDANITGLQIADLLAHPCKEAILIERGIIPDNRGAFTQSIRGVVGQKYNRRFTDGRIEGYGKVFLG